MGRAPAAVSAVDGGTPHAGPPGSPEWGVPTGQRLTREEKKAQTRERLIEAAARVFAEKGFATTSLDEVADAAGLTKGAVYSNFENKEDLVVAALRAHQDRQSGIKDIATAAGTLEEQQAVAGRLFSESVAQERDAFLLLLDFTAYALRTPSVYADFLERHRAGRKEIADMIEEAGAGRDAKGFKTDAYRAALIFEVVGNGIALEKLIDPEGVPNDLFDRLMPVLIEAFEAGRL
jgi:AcrR family transcriptional regulator